jgi:hypothetical protein
MLLLVVTQFLGRIKSAGTSCGSIKRTLVHGNDSHLKGRQHSTAQGTSPFFKYYDVFDDEAGDDLMTFTITRQGHLRYLSAAQNLRCLSARYNSRL